MIEFRAKKGLPLVCTRYMELAFKSILARANHNKDITLVSWIVNNSHVHLMAIPGDNLEEFKEFYSQIMTNLNKAVKKLIGRKRNLSLWEEVSVYPIDCVDTCKKRLSYIFSNPSQDNLTDTIEQYPGCNTFTIFKNNMSDLEALVKEDIPWIREQDLFELSDLSPTPSEDRVITKHMLRISKEKTHNAKHTLKVYPNAWIACYLKDSTKEEVEDLNNSVMTMLRAREAEMISERASKGKIVIGAKALRRTMLMADHTPKKKKGIGRILFLAASRERHLELEKEYKKFVYACRECLCAWRAGDHNVLWPPGAFLPPLPLIDTICGIREEVHFN